MELSNLFFNTNFIIGKAGIEAAIDLANGIGQMLKDKGVRKSSDDKDGEGPNDQQKNARYGG